MDLYIYEKSDIYIKSRYIPFHIDPHEIRMKSSFNNHEKSPLDPYQILSFLKSPHGQPNRTPVNRIDLYTEKNWCLCSIICMVSPVRYMYIM